MTLPSERPCDYCGDLFLGFTDDRLCRGCPKPEADVTVTSIDVTICSVPYSMRIVDGGVLFSGRSGSHVLRFMFSYDSIWRLVSCASGEVPLSHLVRMKELLQDYIGDDFELGDSPLAFRRLPTA